MSTATIQETAPQGLIFMNNMPVAPELPVGADLNALIQHEDPIARVVERTVGNMPASEVLAQSAAPEATVGYLGGLAMSFQEKASNLSNRFRRNSAVAGAVAVAAFGASAPASANESVSATPTITTKVEVGVAGSKQTVESASKAVANVVGNYRTVSKAKIERAKRKGDCETISGKEAINRGIKTQGYKGTGKGFAYENRRSTMCDTDGDGDIDVRAECGNAAREGKANPVKAKATIWANSFAKAMVSVKASASAKAVAICKTANTYAAAYGSGEASAKASAKVSIVQKAKGKLQSLVNRATGNANDSASAKASAQATVGCAEMGGTVVSITPIPETPKPPVVPPTEQPPVTPPKDGTQTPAPPATAPGTNPPPSSQDPAIGGNQCFSEATGQPVEANMDTTCPVGSTSGPA